MHKNIKENISLAQYVVERREILGLSREELALKSSLDLNTIASIEEGYEPFLATTIRQKLAKGLRVDNKEIKKHERKEDFTPVKKSKTCKRAKG